MFQYRIDELKRYLALDNSPRDIDIYNNQLRWHTEFMEVHNLKLNTKRATIGDVWRVTEEDIYGGCDECCSSTYSYTYFLYEDVAIAFVELKTKLGTDPRHLEIDKLKVN